MTDYNLQQTDRQLSFQPNRSYRGKIITCLAIAAAAFILPFLVRLNTEFYGLVMGIGCFGIGYAVYDFLFKVNLTYVFDRANGYVYMKYPGFFSRKLMPLSEVYLLPETTNCLLHYVISNGKDRFGRNYDISDYFSGGKKGQREQELFETTVLAAITAFLETSGEETPYRSPSLN
ncbi:hypothetical protein [Chitinophaga solisilvae]|uniref:hypothetical protein n=1 Tax=Chitinophaga solisilvae TaxID=1233460 RepID=UPI00136E3197|nr:hypothetical protein [Chitinophaga solisilvae]